MKIKNCIYLQKPSCTGGNAWATLVVRPSLCLFCPRERERSERERLSPFPQCQECVYIEHVQVVPAQTGCVAVGQRPKGDRVHHALVEHQAVLLGAGGDLGLFGGRMTREKMGLGHGHVASVVEGVGEFVEDVLPQDVVIQLLRTPHVEGEASHLAFHFATLGPVPIILGAPGGEIHDVVVPFQLVRHFPQVIPRREVGFTGKMGVDDGVGVEVEDLFLQPLEVLVQFQSRVTGGEGGDEEVHAPVVRLVVSGIGVDHFQCGGVADPHRVNVVGGIGDEMEEVRGGGDDLGGWLAEVLAEFSPEGVEHQFGRGFLAGVLCDALGVELDTLALVVVSDYRRWRSKPDPLCFRRRVVVPRMSRRREDCRVCLCPLSPPLGSRRRLGRFLAILVHQGSAQFLAFRKVFPTRLRFQGLGFFFSGLARAPLAFGLFAFFLFRSGWLVLLVLLVLVLVVRGRFGFDTPRFQHPLYSTFPHGLAPPRRLLGFLVKVHQIFGFDVVFLFLVKVDQLGRGRGCGRRLGRAGFFRAFQKFLQRVFQRGVQHRGVVLVLLVLVLVALEGLGQRKTDVARPDAFAQSIQFTGLGLHHLDGHAIRDGRVAENYAPFGGQSPGLVQEGAFGDLPFVVIDQISVVPGGHHHHLLDHSSLPTGFRNRLANRPRLGSWCSSLVSKSAPCREDVDRRCT